MKLLALVAAAVLALGAAAAPADARYHHGSGYRHHRHYYGGWRHRRPYAYCRHHYRHCY